MAQWCKGPGQNPSSYTQTMSMCVQCSTYLETGAHMCPEMEDVSEVGPGEHVTRERPSNSGAFGRRRISFLAVPVRPFAPSH